MILELFSTAALAFCAWGILLMAFKLFSRKPPRFLVPLVIGVAILAFNIYNEYSWVERAKIGLPDGLVAVKEVTSKSLFRPWTLIFPRVDKVVVVDTMNVRRHPDKPNMAMTETAILSRYAPTMTATHVIDCVNRRRADILPNTAMGADGLPINIEWRELLMGDRLLVAVCGY